MYVIADAVSPSHWACARELMTEYAQSLGIDLSFQDFDREVAGLPGPYAPPHGCFLLALDGPHPLGCVAVRPLEAGVCELKRLYVRPEGRARGLGRDLTLRAIVFARRTGYRAMRLDTLPSMKAAQALYRTLGFRPIPPYRPNPVPGAEFMELDLGPDLTASPWFRENGA